VALRAGIEMVGTLAVGVGIGWALDLWLGTGPWLLVVFFFVGAAAGMLNVYRAMSGMDAGAGSRGGSGDDEDGDSGGAGRRPGPPPAE
jgi:ATP synthase protein I